MKAAEWIDRVKTVRGLPSDYAVAKELGLSRFTVSGYRQRPDATMDDEISIRVANAISAPPELVLLDQAAERAKTEEVRSVFRGVLGRLAGVAASVSLTACVFVGAGDVEARTLPESPQPLYIMLIVALMAYASTSIANKQPQPCAGLAF